MTMATSAKSAEAKAHEENLASILSSDDFTVADYLNAALTVSDDDALQRNMTETALQLQYQAAHFHEEIGRIGAELSAVLPRCAADVGRVGVGLEGLQMDCRKLLESNAASHDGEAVSSSLQTLSTLHILQAKLQRTKAILHAQATWDATLDTIHRHMAENKLPEAVHAMAALQEGRAALAGMPGASERLEAVDKVRASVQQLLAPALQNALAVLHTRVSPMQQLVGLYTALGDTEALIDAYVQFRPSSLHTQWFAYDSSQQELLTFVNEWLEAVHSLVAEERRQTTTLFGDSATVPRVALKVLKECFRPILPSFQSRLKTIYAVNGNTGTGSFEMICSLYQAILQFLSLVYETIVVSWMDMIEAGKLSQSQSAELYKELSRDFETLASPFADYQRNLAKLETKYLTSQTSPLSRDIQEATSVPDPLNNLETVTEHLQSHAVAVFDLAQQAVARWEVLGAGWQAAAPLQAIDGVVASHAKEVAVAVQKLSTATQGNGVTLDESHVVCALQILKVAGSFQRLLRDNLEGQTRNRFGLLLERVAAHAARDLKLEGKAFQVPDALSPIEVDSLLASGVSDDTTENTLEALQNLANEPTLYQETSNASFRLTAACHTFVYDVCSLVPRRALSNLNSMACWSAAPSQSELDAYGTLPQEYITHVGEHMLSLVQALEPFAMNTEALRVANEIMAGARNVAKQPWLDIVSEVTGRNTEGLALQLMGGIDLEDFMLGHPPLDEEEDEEENEESKAITEFCNAWLDVVGLGITGRLLERILRIPVLTLKGCEHMSADLNYLVNVLSALGVSGHPHPLLGHLAELVTLDEQIASERVKAMDRSSDLAGLVCSIEERILAMRQAC